MEQGRSFTRYTTTSLYGSGSTRLQHPINDALFTRYFTVRYQLYKLTNYMEHTPELEETDVYLQSMDFAHAWMLGLILPKKYTGN